MEWTTFFNWAIVFIGVLAFGITNHILKREDLGDKPRKILKKLSFVIPVASLILLGCFRQASISSNKKKAKKIDNLLMQNDEQQSKIDILNIKLDSSRIKQNEIIKTVNRVAETLGIDLDKHPSLESRLIEIEKKFGTLSNKIDKSSPRIIGKTISSENIVTNTFELDDGKHDFNEVPILDCDKGYLNILEFTVNYELEIYDFGIQWRNLSDNVLITMIREDGKWVSPSISRNVVSNNLVSHFSILRPTKYTMYIYSKNKILNLKDNVQFTWSNKIIG